MSRNIKRKKRILEVPETQQRKRIITKIQPLLKELMQLMRSERQVEIDNTIMRVAGALMTSAKECDLYLDVANFTISPLWSEATVLSDRKCKAELSYTEQVIKDHTTDVKAIFVIKEKKISVKVDVNSHVLFDSAMSPNAQALLLLNDKLSEDYSTSVEVFSSQKCEIQKLQLGTGKIEINRIGGEVRIGFVIERITEDEMVNAINDLRKISKAIASANIFKKGVIIVKDIDKEGRIIGQTKEITESQLVDIALDE